MTIRSIVYDKASGKCAVAINGFAGNAYLYTSGDGSNNVWGSTVWITEGEITNTPMVNGVQIMDRNLGAHAATATQPTPANAYKYFGNLYQWGRFQPFTSQGNTTSTSVTYPAIFDENANARAPGSVGGFVFLSGGHSLSTVITNPRAYFNNAGSVILNNPNTWSDTGDKSIYDPCPFGYRVAPSGCFEGFPGANQGTAITNGIEWNSTWWPMTGFRYVDDGSLRSPGLTCYYWVSNAKDPISAYSKNISSNTVLETTQPRAIGFDVRCVVE